MEENEINPRVGEYWLTDWGVRKVIEADPDFYNTVGEVGIFPEFLEEIQKEIPYGALYKIHVKKFFHRLATKEEIAEFETKFPSNDVVDRITEKCNWFRQFWIENNTLSLERAFWRWYSAMD